MTELVCVGIDRGVQPVTLAVDANHRLITRDLIRIDVAVGLKISFIHPVMNRGSTSFDTQTVKILFGILKR
jgi:hypothetical protein